MSEVSTDWWLSAEARLQMPKREIGDYVESQGFLVPERFDTLGEALDIVRAGGAIVLRSEHPTEYDGPSGLMHSYVVNEDIFESSRRTLDKYGNFDIDKEIHLSQRRGVLSGNNADGPGYGQVEDVVLGTILDTPVDLTIQRLKTLTSYWHPVRRYADLTGRKMPELIDEVTYSFWEYVPGKNVTVIADSAIDNRYHVLANAATGGKRIPSYYGWQIANENGESSSGKLDDEVLKPDVVKEVVQTYEAIRNLSRFASEHCPVMELQIDDNGQIWFLQTHRVRDFHKAGSPLNPADYPAHQGWQQADAVRGAIDSPKTLQMALWYPDYYGSQSKAAAQMPDIEDASTDWHYDLALSEILSRRRIGFVDVGNQAEIYSKIAAAHDRRSKWFKSVAAVACADRGLRSMISETVYKEISDTVHRRGVMARAVIDLAVDGNNGYIRLNPDSDQPIYTTS